MFHKGAHCWRGGPPNGSVDDFRAAVLEEVEQLALPEAKKRSEVQRAARAAAIKSSLPPAATHIAPCCGAASGKFCDEEGNLVEDY